MTDTPTIPTPADPDRTLADQGASSTHDPHHERRWLILAVLGIAQLMVVLDATVVNIALPHAQSGLHFSNVDRQWIVTAYSLAFGSLLLLGGRLADSFGRKRVFLIGVIGFAAASAVGGASQDFIMFVCARAVQGAFGAMLAPAALSLLTTTFTHPDERGKAFGIYGGIAAAGASLGLLLGGILTQEFDWRATMYVNVIFAIIAAIGGFILLVDRQTERQHKIDLPGTALAVLSTFGIVYGFAHAAMKSGSAGWTDPQTIISIAVGIILLIAFVIVQGRVQNPLLPLRVLRDRNRGAAYSAMFLAAIGMFGVFLFLTYYLEHVLGYTPIKTGIAFLPLSGTILIVAGIASTILVRRVGPRRIVPVGLLLASGGLAWMTRIGLHSHYYSTILPPLVLLAIGLGLVFAPSFQLGTFGVSRDDAGVASAMVNVSQQIGGSMGTALLNSIATSAAATYFVNHNHGQINGRAKTHLELLAQVHSYTTAFWVGAAVFVIAAIVVGSLLRPGIPDLAANEALAIA
jgi:EmrB/QacA subfamily drug resistance transporter